MGLESFLVEYLTETYLVNAGLKGESDVDKILERYSNLFRVEDVVVLLRNLGDVLSRNKARLLVQMLVEYSGRSLVKKALDIELNERVNGVPYRSILAVIAREDERGRRRELYMGRLKVLDERLNPIYEELRELEQRIARDLGFPNYLELCNAIKGVDHVALMSALIPVVESTDLVYVGRMSEELRRRMGLELTDAERHDIIRFFSGVGFELPIGEGIKLLKQITESLGFNIEKVEGIKLDLEDRPLKSTRAFVAPINPPKDVRLVVRPRGGLEDLRALFHEAGHALHYAHVDPNLPPEARWIGDPAITEAYAFLFEHILLEPGFASLLKSPDYEEYLKFQLLSYLHIVRRYVGKLSYEIRLHKGLPSRCARALYPALLKSTTYYNYFESEYLVDVDPLLYTADYLRAWIFEAMLRSYLRRRFGDLWFLEKEVGDFLKSLWSLGYSKSFDEIVREVGFRSLDTAPLIEQFKSPSP